MNRNWNNFEVEDQKFIPVNVVNIGTSPIRDLFRTMVIPGGHSTFDIPVHTPEQKILKPNIDARLHIKEREIKRGIRRFFEKIRFLPKRSKYSFFGGKGGFGDDIYYRRKTFLSRGYYHISRPVTNREIINNNVYDRVLKDLLLQMEKNDAKVILERLEDFLVTTTITPRISFFDPDESKMHAILCKVDELSCWKVNILVGRAMYNKILVEIRDHDFCRGSSRSDPNMQICGCNIIRNDDVPDDVIYLLPTDPMLDLFVSGGRPEMRSDRITEYGHTIIRMIVIPPHAVYGDPNTVAKLSFIGKLHEFGIDSAQETPDDIDNISLKRTKKSHAMHAIAKIRKNDS